MCPLTVSSSSPSLLFSCYSRGCFLKSQQRKRGFGVCVCVYFCFSVAFLLSFLPFLSFPLSFPLSLFFFKSIKFPRSFWFSWAPATLRIEFQALLYHPLQHIPAMDLLWSSSSLVHFVSVQTHCFPPPISAPRATSTALRSQ